MQVTFYGVRGSCPAPGPEFVRYGGNTSCVHVSLLDGTDIILDAGTGIKKLGQQLVKKSTDIHLLLSHNHWDHIQGFPFFAPIYQANRNIIITPGQTTLVENDAILKQMSGSYFPVHYEQLKANIQIIPQAKEVTSWMIGAAKVSRLAMNHPGGGSSFSIEAEGKKLTFITDNELYPTYKKNTDFLQWVSFSHNADLIIHDAQYMLEDMPAKSGWGHSIAEEAVKLAMGSRAKRMALYSHDHIRTDTQIAAIERHCQEVIAIGGADLEIFAAAEGITLKL